MAQALHRDGPRSSPPLCRASKAQLGEVDPGCPPGERLRAGGWARLEYEVKLTSSALPVSNDPWLGALGRRSQVQAQAEDWQ